MIKINQLVKYNQLQSRVEDQAGHQLKNLLLKAKNKKRMINNFKLNKMRLKVLARFSKQKKTLIRIK